MADEINTTIMYEKIKRMAEDHMVRWMMRELERALLTLDFPGLIPFPGPRPDPVATMKLQAKIFDNTKTAMAFSNCIADTITERGIELKDDETFACAIYVVKKPTYISEVVDPTPEPALTPHMLHPDSPADLGIPFPGAAWRTLCYRVIMEPVIMEKVIKKRQEDKINYKQVK
jgi:hypothetical protein